jgi:ribonucleoside-diphosphate reductase alpha chain
MVTLAPISQQIWDMKYRLKAADGTPVDGAIADSWRRVARAIAAVEKEPSRWERPFYEALEDFRFLPAGRILAGAGSERRVTLFNCFVMGTIPDDMGGIFEHLREAALTMQAGGGIGYDFSTLRPKGAPVKGVGADASGPLTFMDVWDAMCRIMSAGHRRGAMMATLRCDHPDVEAFIAAKQEAGRLRMFNLSLLVTDAFMGAVAQDEPWELKFGGVTYKTVQARELWERIMRATYAYAEPGVIFIDRINRRNNLHYCETIAATNPCVTAETWIATADGPRQVRDLVGRPFDALVDGRAWRSGEAGFFSTGRKPVLRLVTREGHALRLTADHPVRAVRGQTRWALDCEWRPAGALRPGDRIALHDHRAAPDWSGPWGADEGYLAGLLLAGGELEHGAPVLTSWPGEAAVNASGGAPGREAVLQRAGAAAEALGGGARWETGRNGLRRLRLPALRKLAEEWGLSRAPFAVTPALERGSAAFCAALLQALFDAGGELRSGEEVALRLAPLDGGQAAGVQRMLLRFGVAARRDGDGLALAGANVARFAELIGFADGDKAARLRAALAGASLGRERFIAEVAEVAPDGEAEVFDAAVPGINAFDANGFYVHNCGEQPLPPYGACLLGSVNLARLVRDPFGPSAALDEEALDALARTAVRMMDDVIDVSNFPLPQQRHEAQAKRRIGLGVTGLADALIFCKQRYGSEGSLALVERWMARLRRAAYLASAELAAEKGAFPLFDREKYLAGESVRELDEDVRAAIARHGVRNALITSIAPTGTISLLADNVSSGLEPVFSFSYSRYVLMPDGTRREEQVSDYAYRAFRARFGEAAQLPGYFVDAQTLSPVDHVRMQAAVQKYVDSSISKTINCPEDISFEAFKDVYLQAYELGCKGCTTYRPNDVTGAVLQVKKDADEATRAVEPELPLGDPPARPRDRYDAGGVVYMTQPLDRPEALPGATYKITWPESDHAIYITLNDIVQDGRRRPFEIFINSKNMEHFAWTVALTRMISAVFRRGGDVAFVVEELKAVFDPRGGHWVAGRYVPSLLAAIGDVIEKHMIAIGFMRDPKAAPAPEAEPKALAAGGPEPGRGESRLRSCPRCSQPGLIRQENCDTCLTCGYSKCS